MGRRLAPERIEQIEAAKRAQAIANETYELPTPAPAPPGPLVLEVRVGPPGQGKIIFSQRVYAHTIDQQTHHAVITGALRPTSESDV